MRRVESLDHLGLNVADVKRSYEFYRDFVGLRAGSYDDEFAEVRAGNAIFGLLRGEPSPEGVHFGFREEGRGAVNGWGDKAKAAGVHVSFGPGLAEWGRYEVIIHDRGGYEIQIWTDTHG